MGSLVKRLRHHNNKKTFIKYLTNTIFREAETKLDEMGYNNKHIKIPDGVTEILDKAFLSKQSLKSIIISKNVKSIGDYSFYYCQSLKYIVIPEGVSIIGLRTFDVCSSLKNIIIPKSINCVGNQAFAYCRNIKKLSMPEKYKYFIHPYCNVFECVDFKNVEITYI